MANLQGPGGFTPVRHMTGAPYASYSVPYIHRSNDASIIQIGDVVELEANPTTGLVAEIVGGLDTEGMLTCKRGANGTGSVLAIGVCVGFMASTTQGPLPTQEAPASTSRIILVETAPDVVFECREDGVTTSLIATDMGLNISYSTTAGNTTTKRSGMEVISTARATTSTLPFRLLGLTKRPGNSFATSPDKARFDVLWNANFWIASVGTVT